MPLNLVSNDAANIANRILRLNDARSTRAIANISSGRRVLSPRDDASSHAIIERVRAELASLRQAGINAQQATAQLEIVSGAYSSVSDILVRLKALAVQAGSGQLSDSDRSLVDQNYQQLLQEIDRIARDTEFNGSSLISGSITQETASFFDAPIQHGLTFSFSEGADNSVYTYAYDSSTEILTVRNLGDGSSAQVDITTALDAAAGTAANLVGNTTLEVAFGQYSLSVTLDARFDRSTDIAARPDPVVATTTATGHAESGETITAINYADSAAFQVLVELGVLDADSGVLSLTLTSDGTNVGFAATTGIRYGTGNVGEASATETTGNTLTTAFSVEVDGRYVEIATLAFEVASTVAGAGATDTFSAALGGQAFGISPTSSDTTSFTFRVGSGTESYDSITIALRSVTAAALSIDGTDVATVATANTAAGSADDAIFAVSSAQAQVGAFQNRLESTSNNLDSFIVNTEAARSVLQDLNIAAAVSEFTSYRILVQASISVLAQANQLPENLLRLLQ